MQKIYFFSLVTLIIILSYALTKQLTLNEPLLVDQNNSTEYMKDLNIYNYDPKGTIKNHIFANFWQFSSNYGISMVKQPKITIFKYPNYVYYIAANSGQIRHKNLNLNIELIKLFSDVIIQQKILNNSNKEGFNLNTNYLEFTPNSELVTTDHKVKIYKPGLTITATGMEADLKTHQVELKKDVLTEYNISPKNISNDHHE